MKRWIVGILACLLLCSLTACAQQETVYTVTQNGVEYHVDSAQMIITAGGNKYRYTHSGDSTDHRITITYPDGSSYWYSQSGSMGQGGWSEDFVEGKYASADVLIDIVQESAPPKKNPGKTICAVLLIVLGIFEAALPKAAWYLGYGWRYKNAEPSDAALLFGRAGGVVAAVAGLILLFVS